MTAENNPALNTLIQDHEAALRLVGILSAELWQAKETRDAAQAEATRQTLVARAVLHSRIADAEQFPSLLNSGQIHALRDVLWERAQQDQQHGGPAHDDTHTVEDWLGFMEAQAMKVPHGRVMNGNSVEPRDVCRERFVKIAALAIAAIESHDRIVAAHKRLEHGE